MKKEYKDFYRFLWDYLEGGNSALIIKPRNVGMTNFSARYAAWCLDYKGMKVEIDCPKLIMKTEYWKLVDKYRCTRICGYSDMLRNDSVVVPEDYTEKSIHIFDEMDFGETNKYKKVNYEGLHIDQFLAYSTIHSLNGIIDFKQEIVPRCRTRGEIRVFDISNHLENKFYEETFYRKH